MLMNSVVAVSAELFSLLLLNDFSLDFDLYCLFMICSSSLLFLHPSLLPFSVLNDLSFFIFPPTIILGIYCLHVMWLNCVLLTDRVYLYLNEYIHICCDCYYQSINQSIVY